MAGRTISRVKATRLMTLLGSSSIAVLLLSAPSAFAQTAPAPAAGTMQRSITFAIPPQSLSTGIVAFSRAAGVDLVFDGAVPSGARTPGVSGTLTVREGVNQLLAGTGLTARLTGARTVQIVNPSSAGASVGAMPAGAVALDTIDVQGENPLGPVNGYVANQSMTGTKTNTPIIETPQSISVIGREQIRDQNINAKFDETLRYTAGVFGGTAGSDPRNDWFQIRGFQVQEQSTFLDSLQLTSMSFATWKIQPFGLDRVEVLRGPSAMLFGGSGAGGIVNAVSRFAGEEPTRYIEAGVNNFGNAYTQFDVGGPLNAGNDGKLFYRIVGQIRGGGTQVNFINDDNYFLQPSLTWMPDIDTRLTIYAQASHNVTRGLNFLPYEGTVVNAPFGRIPTNLFASEPSMDRQRRDQAMVGYQFEKHLSENVTFRQNARYGYVDLYNATMFGGGYLTTPAAADLYRDSFLVRSKASQANMDSQLESRFETGPVSHKVLGGFNLKRFTLDDMQGIEEGLPINLVNPVYTPTAPFSGAPYRDAHVTQNQVALYLQDQIKFDRLTLVLSGRNDWVGTIDNDLARSYQTREDSKFSGRGGIIYNFDFGLAPYASYATSYNPIVGINGATGNILLPQTAVQSEVGLKYQPTGLNARFGVALFDLKRRNALTTDPNNPQLQIQNGEVTSRGLELEAVANITRDFKITASYTNFNFFVSKDLDTSLIGTVPVSTPRELASLWTDYTFREGALSGFGLGGGVRYVGSSFANTANTLIVPAVVLGDLAVHYEWGDNWRAAVNFINVADTIYVATCSSSDSCFYGDRRRITGSLSYKW